MKSLIFAAAVLFSSFVFAHEGHDNNQMVHLTYKLGKVHGHINWQQGPHLNEESVFLIEFMNSAHKEIEITDKLSVTLKMIGMDHGSVPTQIQRNLDEQGDVIPGSYVVSNIYFTMPGTWEVQVSLTAASGKVETQKFRVEIAGQGTDPGHQH